MRNCARYVLAGAMLVSILSSSHRLTAQAASGEAGRQAGRERLLMDFGWKFALGHEFEAKQDFNFNTVTFSSAKAGSADGPASPRFDDRAWQVIDLPHDWAAALAFDPRGDGNHGSKAIGRNFPEHDVGWYRKTFNVPASDLGRRMGVQFDGVYRDSVAWINGHYLGEEHSGYSSFAYDMTDYLNYGGSNVLVVRANAIIEEGWFYEGAGIYRHVWLTRTAPLHVAHDGAFVTTEVNGDSAAVTARVTVQNEGLDDQTFAIGQTIVDAQGKTIAAADIPQASVKAAESGDFSTLLHVANPALWSIETPYLHKLITTISSGGKVVDRYETSFGIRTIRWDANQGFFLNGKHVEIKGTDDHQDHAGLGVALPDEINDYRVARLKEAGSNAIRTSHHPPTPELLDACDRLGMLVLDEHRMMSTSPEILDQLRRLVLRDRNHPSVVLWSVGNEEWAIEGTVPGERINAFMQAYVKRLDPTRRTTVAMSSSGGGVSLTTDVFGFNYFRQHDIDKMHARFPDRPVVGTEESSSTTTRGVYVEDLNHQHLTAYDHNKDAHHASIEEAWNFHVSRPFSAGLFYWTGFDYRGETTPFGWPAISSQFGLLDTCGFFKDNAYLVKSWWTSKPMVHVLPHWNWPGREGESINVRVYSNAAEVELSLNGQSLGRKPMPPNSHLEWDVKYAPGKLVARGYTDGKEVASDTVETTGAAAAIRLTAYKSELLGREGSGLKADGESVSLITVTVTDSQGRMARTASSNIAFALDGPGKIIGVGNGDPSSHEPDQYVESVSAVPLVDWRLLPVDGPSDRPEVAADYDDSSWKRAEDRRWDAPPVTSAPPAATVYRGSFTLPDLGNGASVKLILRNLGQQQSIYLNGKLLGRDLARTAEGFTLDLDAKSLRPGRNVVAVVATPMPRAARAGMQFRWSDTGPGLVRISTPPAQWKRSLFNGLAQVIVQSTQQPGEIRLKATSTGLLPAELPIESTPATLRAAVPAQQVEPGR
ncbi:MAG TPA: beta-galactosidase GalA [Acidisarcina sp.]